MRFYKSALALTSASLVAATAVYSLKENSFISQIKPVSSLENLNLNEVSNDYLAAATKGLADLKRFKNELGLPGVVIGVSVNGKVVWTEGLGFSNIETQTPCNAKTKMRIASISKPITMALLAKQQEMGLVDLDKSIQLHVPYFPIKLVDGKPVTITPRHLACHKSGVRHYKKMEDSDGDGGPEFYLKEHFKTTEQSVDIFKDDELLFPPGENFQYTTHGYTLLSAVIEGVGAAPFSKLLREHLVAMGLKNVHLDEVSTIVYDRANYYHKDKRGALINASLTDNSYKWAGGGLLSNIDDILKFGNIMLYSYQQDGTGITGFLKSSTVKELWTSVPGTKMSWSQDAGYGLGWIVVPKQRVWLTDEEGEPFHVGHSGGAVGASSVLLIFPSENRSDRKLPCGVTIAIFTNLQDVGLYKVAKEIAKYFMDADIKKSTIFANK